MKTIVVPVDFSAVSDKVVETAADLAQTLQARMVLVHVIQTAVVASDYTLSLEAVHQVIESSEDVATEQLAKIEKRLKAAYLDVTSVLHQGTPVPIILEEARKQEADFIVMGTHGHGAFYDLLVGSTTHGVLNGAECPVLIVPQIKKKAAKQSAA